MKRRAGRKTLKKETGQEENKDGNGSGRKKMKRKAQQHEVKSKKGNGGQQEER
ncbi:MAG: hypothetical protein ACRCU6_10450 [Fusobacteriaceae bacterium]